MDSSNKEPKKLSLLVVDDEPELLELLVENLRLHFTDVISFPSIQPVLDHLTSNKADLILSDIRMPGGSGFDLIRKLKESGQTELPVILVTGFLDTSNDDAIQAGASAVLHKPYKMKDVLATIETVLASPK